jgi:hypothetical protein
MKSLGCFTIGAVLLKPCLSYAADHPLKWNYCTALILTEWNHRLNNVCIALILATKQIVFILARFYFK